MSVTVRISRNFAYWAYFTERFSYEACTQLIEPAPIPQLQPGSVVEVGIGGPRDHLVAMQLIARWGCT